MQHWQAGVTVVLWILQYYLSDQYKPPKILYPDRHLVVFAVVLHTFEINCTATGDPQPTFNWTHNGTDIQQNSQMRVNSPTGTLHVDIFQHHDVGVYRCFASSSTGTLRVTSMSPAVHVRLANLERYGDRSSAIIHTRSEYEYFRLKCDDNQTSVANDLRYGWFDYDQHLIDHKGHRLFVDQRGNLHFTYLDYSDKNVTGYYCGVYMYVDGTKHVSVGIKNVIRFVSPPQQRATAVAPRLQYSNTGVKGLLSSTVILECMFSGYDPVPPKIPVVTWMNSRGQVYPVNEKFNISEGGRQLIISNVQEGDELSYFCHANNSAGTNKSVVDIDVRSGPIFIKGRPPDHTIYENANALFECDARSLSGQRAPGVYLWYINGKLVQQHYDRTKFQFSPGNKSLMVNNVKKATDIMCVQCEVSNEVDTTFASACLSILLPITIVKQPPLIQSIKYGDTVDLTVKPNAETLHDVNYRWHFQNATYEENKPPPYLSYNPATKEAKISTKGLTPEQYVTIEGVYNITVFHTLEAKSVTTQLVLLSEKTGSPADKPPEDTSEAGYLEANWHVLLGVASFILFATLICLFIVCIRRKTYDNREEDQAETGKKRANESSILEEVIEESEDVSETEL